MGLSSSKSKTTTNQTTTPVISQPYDEAFKGFTNKITDFVNTDPTQYVAPASQLQQQAFNRAQNLGAGTPHIKAASDYAASAANAPASSVSLGGYKAPTIDNVKVGSASTYGGAQLDDPARLIQYMQDYQNPYSKQVIDAALADYDQQAGMQRAAMAADAGKTAAFGGSRYGIAQGQLEGELARGRAATEANLLDQQYRLAAQLAGTDAGAANQFALQQGSLTQQAGLANMDAINNFRLQQAQLNQQTALSQADLRAQSAKSAADAANQQSIANAQLAEQQYQRQLAAAGLESNLAQTAGSQELADLSATAQLGDTQRQIQRDTLNAVPTQLQLAGQLYSELYPGIYAGQNMTGSSTTTSSPAWGPMVLGSALQAAGTAASGGFKF
jgi:hypothetical protein